MKKAWSFFWLVVASCVAVVFIAEIIKPYIGLIAVVLVLVVIGIVTAKVYGFVSARRRHF